MVVNVTWWLIPVIAVFLVPGILVEARMARVQWDIWATKGDERHVFGGLETILQDVKGQMELRSTQAQEHVQRRMSMLNAHFYGEQEHRFRRINPHVLTARLLETAGAAAGSVVLLHQFLGGQISLERYFFLSAAVARMGGALAGVFGTVSRMAQPALFVRNYFEVIDSRPTMVDPPGAVPVGCGAPPRITFDNVSFTYLASRDRSLTAFRSRSSPGSTWRWWGRTAPEKPR